MELQKWTCSGRLSNEFFGTVLALEKFPRLMSGVDLALLSQGQGDTQPLLCRAFHLREYSMNGVPWSCATRQFWFTHQDVWGS